MRKALTLAFIFFCFNISFASVPATVPPLKASEIFIPIGQMGEKISLLELSRINIKDFELLRGEKMKFFDRVGFKIAQKKLKKNINSDGTLNNKKLVKSFTKNNNPKRGWLGGFALGSLLGPIGVLIAYLIKDGHKKTRVTWAWIGLIAFIPMWLLIFVTVVGISGGF